MSALGLTSTALDDLSVEKARLFLLDLAKVENATLTLIGAEPADEPVWVVDTLTEVGVGCQDSALKAYARTNGLEILGPIEVRSETGVADSTWEVHMQVADSQPSLMLSAPTLGEALGQMRASLSDIAGSCVLPIGDWAAIQAAGSLEEALLAPTVPPKVKLTPFVNFERMPLTALPLSSTIANARADLSKRKLRRKFAYDALLSPQGMGHQLVETKDTGWNIPVLTDETMLLANHHDLLAAIRLGLDIGEVQPWPNDIAHKFLVHEELRYMMRSRGYAELTDFDATKAVSLRTSLNEFSEEVTGEKQPKRERLQPQEKPQWPPLESQGLRVVIVLGRARLAYEIEPEWESVAIRDAVECCGSLWVEIDGPHEKRKLKKRAARTK